MDRSFCTDNVLLTKLPLLYSVVLVSCIIKIVHARASNFTDLSVKTRNCTAKYGARIRSLKIRICAYALFAQKMDEFTSKLDYY